MCCLSFSTVLYRCVTYWLATVKNEKYFYLDDNCNEIGLDCFLVRYWVAHNQCDCVPVLCLLILPLPDVLVVTCWWCHPVFEPPSLPADEGCKHMLSQCQEGTSHWCRSFGHSSLGFFSDGMALRGKCRLTTCWLANWTWPQTKSIRDEKTLSSLVETGTVNDLWELAKWAHRINRFHSLSRSMCWHLSSTKSSIEGLIQRANPGEELSQCRSIPVFAPQLLPVVPQTDQSSVPDGCVDVVPVW